MRMFISYTLRDKFLNVQDLQRLEHFFSFFGDPYIDILHNKSLKPQEYVIKNLKQSKIFFALITPKYFESSWVQLELNIAIQNHIPIIAVFLIERTNNSIHQMNQLNVKLVA